jgi:hypothetical protein
MGVAVDVDVALRGLIRTLGQPGALLAPVAKVA